MSSEISGIEDENNIHQMINKFEEIRSRFSPEEMKTLWLRLQAQTARMKILDLQHEIEKQEAVILQIERDIRKYKPLIKESNSVKGRGRPVVDEYRVRVAKKFISEWVSSLMDVLEVKSCQKLEQLISPHTTIVQVNKAKTKVEDIIVNSKATERNWRRWLKGEALLNYKTFEILLETKIVFGKHKGHCLIELPTQPDPRQLRNLLNLI